MYAQKFRPAPKKKRTIKKTLALLLTTTLLCGAAYLYVSSRPKPTVEQKIENQLVFSDGFAEAEKQRIREALKAQAVDIRGEVSAHVDTTFAPNADQIVFDVLLPVTNFSNGRQSLTADDLKQTPPLLWHEIDTMVAAGVSTVLELEPASMETLQEARDLEADTTALMPLSQLDSGVKLLSLDGTYYLDSLSAGAIFRTVTFSGGNAEEIKTITFSDLPKKDSVLTFNQTGVTALTRVMQRKLTEVGDPLYFSQKIGDFLSAADITHVSNEVSFLENCSYSLVSFCSDPVFIETLTASGVDVVELTGNHNNDRGRDPNTKTIKQYRALGWQTVGGGLNIEDASQFYVADKKGSKVALLAYNFPDSPNGGAIATVDGAGANPFDFDNITADIERAHEQADYVIVDVQYWECYAYPDGYIEYPQCDAPIGQQEEHFKKLIDLGADMVVGTSAHQPQTYELYKDKPIYYGLGNLYFDQTSWPGTERGIILTHYFLGGRLLQTKLTPTRFDESLQTYVLPESDAVELLTRLQASR